MLLPSKKCSEINQKRKPRVGIQPGQLLEELEFPATQFYF